MPDIKINIGDENFNATLEEESAPKTVAEILKVLPIEGSCRTWGDEFYFPIPISVKLENAVESVSIGDLAYWPQGNAFCIFYGKTPMSNDEDEIIPASPVNPVGQIESPQRLKSHESGEDIQISLVKD